MSSRSGVSFSRMDFVSRFLSPPHKSVLPTDPLKRVSPLKRIPLDSKRKQVDPGECPGVCRDFPFKFSFTGKSSSESNSLSGSETGPNVFGIPNKLH